MLRKIFGPKRDEVTGEWINLYNEELRDLYSSLNVIRIIMSRRMRWAGHVARVGENNKEGKRKLGRPRRTRVDNVRMELGKWDRVRWTGLFWLRILKGGELL
jgi:hypothetical protein